DRPPPRRYHGAVRGIFGSAPRSTALSHGNLRRARRRRANTSRRLRRAFGHGTDPLSYPSPNVSRAARASLCGPLKGDSYQHRHRSWILGVGPLLSRVPRIIRGTTLQDIVPTSGADGRSPQSSVDPTDRTP